jgi:hypothetical protein
MRLESINRILMVTNCDEILTKALINGGEALFGDTETKS